MNLKVENLWKKYHVPFKKTKCVVEDLSFYIKEGQVYALVGQNGVGKTTTIKCILKYIKNDKGKVQVGDEGIEILMSNNKVGYLPENLIFPGVVSLEEFLFDLCILRGIDKKLAKERIQQLTYRFNLNDVLDKNISKFSKGMKKKAGFIQAIINEPKVLILDEPTDGLDPISRKEVLKCIREIADRGNIVLITSHILSDLSLISDKVGLMDEGKLISEINPKDYSNEKKSKISFELYKGVEKEERIYDLRTSTEIEIQNADKCIIKEIIFESFDLEQWYYEVLMQRRAEKCGK